LIGNYSDSSLYTGQLRGLEDFVKANPQSAKAQFVLAYHYISDGIQTRYPGPQERDFAPAERQALDRAPPQTSACKRNDSRGEACGPSILPGVWVAQAPPNGTVTLTMTQDAGFTWAFASPGKPPVTISGNYAWSTVPDSGGKDTPADLSSVRWPPPMPTT